MGVGTDATPPARSPSPPAHKSDKMPPGLWATPRSSCPRKAPNSRSQKSSHRSPGRAKRGTPEGGESGHLGPTGKKGVLQMGNMGNVKRFGGDLCTVGESLQRHPKRASCFADMAECQHELAGTTLGFPPGNKENTHPAERVSVSIAGHCLPPKNKLRTLRPWRPSRVPGLSMIH